MTSVERTAMKLIAMAVHSRSEILLRKKRWIFVATTVVMLSRRARVQAAFQTTTSFHMQHTRKISSMAGILRAPTCKHCIGTSLPRQQSVRLAPRPKGYKAFSPQYHLSSTMLLSSSPIEAVTSLSLISPISTFLFLITSSVMGMWADRNPKLQGSGILVTLLSAALLSNQGLVPVHHPLYDLVWKNFLPASLALLLLTSSSTQRGTNNAATNAKAMNDNTRKNVLDSILRVGIAFIVGSLGSILGCAFSFWICCRRQGPSIWMLSPRQAAIAAGCLCASYIGGSVNFFATARIISHSSSFQHGSSSSSTLLGAMATADLVVMAIYFAFLASAVHFKPLQNLFASDKDTTVTSEGGILNQPPPNMDEEPNSATKPDLESNEFNRLGSLARQGSAVVLVSSLALGIVTLANKVEAWCSSILPGTACAVIAIVTPILSLCLNDKLIRHTQISLLWKEMQHQASWLSELAFHWLFISIGASANLDHVLKAGPACLIFSLLALLVHIVVIVTGSWGLQQWKRVIPRITWNDVLIASNAAIGGPATAATFAGRIQPQGSNVSSMSFGLTMAATVWGVVGYAVGTVIGVKLSQTLVRIIV